MEQGRYEGSTQDDFNSKNKAVPCDVNTEIASSHASIQRQVHVESESPVFASPTPEKTIQPSRSKNRQTGLSVRPVKLFSNEYHNDDGTRENESVDLPDGITGKEEVKTLDALTEVESLEIPDKYKPLAEFFDRMDTSIRLLTMHKKLPTFQNICTVVKALTQRIFSNSHLAQIKYLLPEAIRIEKILRHDEKTLCMMPDMKITVLLDVIEAHPDQSAFLALRQVFHQRLLNFVNSHPESSEIPEAMLPEPFCQRNHTVLPLHSSINSPTDPLTAPIECDTLLLSSSFGKSIRKHFSQKIIAPETEKTQLLASSVPSPSVNFADETDLDISIQPQKECSLNLKPAGISSPGAWIPSSGCSNSSVSESPSVKLATLPHQSTVETPVQPTPAKRLPELSSCEKMNETRMLSQTVAKRALNFDESKEHRDISFQTAVVNINLVDDKVTTSPAYTQEVEGNKKHMMNETVPVNRPQMLASLTDLINTIERIFKSARGSFVTKQELLQKIIADDLDIVDIREVEEQLELLEELFPDWIFRKLVPSGDLFYSIRRVSDLDSIRARLSEVV